MIINIYIKRLFCKIRPKLCGSAQHLPARCLDHAHHEQTRCFRPSPRPRQRDCSQAAEQHRVGHICSWCEGYWGPARYVLLSSTSQGIFPHEGGLYGVFLLPPPLQATGETTDGRYVDSKWPAQLTQGSGRAKDGPIDRRRPYCWPTQ